LAQRGRDLLRLQLELEDSLSLSHREALQGKIYRASARLRVRAGRVAREEALPKGWEALAMANYQHQKSAAFDLAAIRGELF
jgi:hypothetical protein